MTISHKAEAAPAVVGGSAYVADKFLGLSIPDWVGLATIIYLTVTTVIAILKYLERKRDQRAPSDSGHGE